MQRCVSFSNNQVDAVHDHHFNEKILLPRGIPAVVQIQIPFRDELYRVDLIDNDSSYSSIEFDDPPCHLARQVSTDTHNKSDDDDLSMLDLALPPSPPLHTCILKRQNESFSTLLSPMSNDILPHRPSRRLSCTLTTYEEDNSECFLLKSDPSVSSVTFCDRPPSPPKRVNSMTKKRT